MVNDLVSYFENSVLSMDNKKNILGKKETRKSIRELRTGRVKKLVNDFTDIKRPPGKTRKSTENLEISQRSSTLPRTKKDKEDTDEFNKLYFTLNQNHTNRDSKVAETALTYKTDPEICDDTYVYRKIEEFGEKLRQRRSQLTNDSINILKVDEEIETKGNEKKVTKKVSFKIPENKKTEEINGKECLKESYNYIPQILSNSEKTDNHLSNDYETEDIFGCNDFDENSEDNFIYEAFNDEGRELIITRLQITRKSIGLNDNINSIISDSDFVIMDEKLNNNMVNIHQEFNTLLDVNSSVYSEIYDDDIHEKGEINNQQNFTVYDNDMQECSKRIEEENAFSEEFKKYLYYEVKSAYSTDSEFSENNELQEDTGSIKSSDTVFSENMDNGSKENFEGQLIQILPLEFRSSKRYYQSFENREQGDNFYHPYINTVNEEPNQEILMGQLSKSEPTSSKNLDKRSIINFTIEELIKTEELYIRSLAVVVENYIPYLQKHTPASLVGKTVYLFGNIEKIYEKAKTFYASLKKHSDSVDEIAQVFIDSSATFDLYPKYSKNKPTADMYIKEFDEIIKEKQKKLKDKLGLASHLLTPIQRLGKYILMLENIQKELKKFNSQSENVNKAINIIRQVMRKGNDSIAVDSIKCCPIDLSLCGSFIMRANFTILKPKKFQAVVFLFDQVIVFTQKLTKNMEQFNYVDSIKMSDLSIAKFEEKECIFHLMNFPKMKKGRRELVTYVLEAESPKIKNDWTEAIEAKLWNQLEQARIQQKKLNSDEGKRFSKVSLPRSPVPLRSPKKGKTRKPTSKFYESA